ncbi:MAG: hypothetical protein ACREF9_11420 [Opitutaceae bacterium]
MSGIHHKLIAACLLAFWLIATQHCALEAAGVLDAHSDGEAAGCCSAANGCATDGCATVEGGAYRPDSAPAAIAAPQLTICLFLADWNITAPPPDILASDITAGHFERPLEWVPTWRFVQRAAPSPRAPSVSFA